MITIILPIALQHVRPFISLIKQNNKPTVHSAIHKYIYYILYRRQFHFHLIIMYKTFVKKPFTASVSHSVNI